MLRFLIIVFANIFILSGCTATDTKTLTQISSIDALLAGSYDGQFTCAQVLNYGDTGIGTFDKLEGEMILIDGKIYQAKADGTVSRVAGNMKTPFAAVVFFKAEQSANIGKPLNLEDLKKTVAGMQKNQNLFTAFKAKGFFKNIKVRSVPAQNKPYRPLLEVTKTQAEFVFNNIQGVLIGFYCPPFVKGVNVPGYHVHFISDDFKYGGHVLSFEMLNGTLETAAYLQFFMLLPDNDETFAKTDLTSDRTEELEKAEK